MWDKEISIHDDCDIADTIYDRRNRVAKTLEDMVRERYSHPEVQHAIMEEVRKLNHEDKILSGELTLPSEYDACRHISGESHWEQADLHARSDSKRYHVGPNPAELEKARAETQRLLGVQ